MPIGGSWELSSRRWIKKGEGKKKTSEVPPTTRREEKLEIKVVTTRQRIYSRSTANLQQFYSDSTTVRQRIYSKFTTTRQRIYSVSTASLAAASATESTAASSASSTEVSSKLGEKEKGDRRSRIDSPRERSSQHHQ